MNSFSVRRSTYSALAIIFFLAVTGFAYPVSAQTRNAPVLTGEKTGYALGVGIGRNMKNLELDIDPDMLARGVRDAVSLPIKVQALLCLSRERQNSCQELLPTLHSDVSM